MSSALFQEFNDGTSGHAGRLDLVHLGATKLQVEDTMRLVTRIASQQDPPGALSAVAGDDALASRASHQFLEVIAAGPRGPGGWRR